MRIITGLYKGKHFGVPHTFRARPTTDYVKESIFSMLSGCIDSEGVMALDLLAGTGNIPMELLSRGCEQVVSVEVDRDHVNLIRHCMQKLGTEENVLIREDIFRFLKNCHQRFDFIFADLPYTLPGLKKVPELVLRYDLLKPNGIFAFEHGKKNDFSTLPQYAEYRHYGSVNFTMFQSKDMQLLTKGSIIIEAEQADVPATPKACSETVYT